jgi:hypothetical protein
MDRCTVDGEEVVPQEGGFYGGWITSRVSGPFKGAPGTLGWKAVRKRRRHFLSAGENAHLPAGIVPAGG